MLNTNSILVVYKIVYTILALCSAHDREKLSALLVPKVVLGDFVPKVENSLRSCYGGGALTSLKGALVSLVLNRALRFARAKESTCFG